MINGYAVKKTAQVEQFILRLNMTGADKMKDYGNNYNRNCLLEITLFVIAATVIFSVLFTGNITWGQGYAGGGMPRMGMPGQGQAGSPLARVAKKIREDAQTILKDYVAAMKPLSSSDITAINAGLKKFKMYYNRLTLEDRAYVLLTQAFAAHYSGDGKSAIKYAQKAVKYYPQNPDFSDSLIYLALYWQDYPTAIKALKVRKAGLAAEKEYQLSWANLSASINVGGSVSQGGSGQSNPFVFSGIIDPNATKKKVKDPNSIKKNKFGINLSPAKAPGAVPKPGMGYGGMPMGGPGSGYGMPMRGGPGMPGGSYGGRQKAKSILSLAVDYMPWQELGKTLGKLQLHNINGSISVYQPQKGQVLCALLWVIPQKGKKVKNRYGNMTPGGMGMPGMGMPGGMYGNNRKGNANEKNGIPAATGDWNKNIAQYRQLFEKMLPLIEQGRVQFLGINLDPDAPSVKARVIDMMMKQALPWANCMAQDSYNKTQLAMLPKASPVLVIAGVDGKICYAGPAGGVLPRVILKRELRRSRARSAGNGNASGGIGFGFLHKMLNMASSAKNNTTNTSNPAGSTVNKQANNSGKQSGGGYNPPNTKTFLKNKVSVVQAKIALGAAYADNSGMMYEDALNQCDKIIKQWPGSKEAYEAQQLIKSILQKNPDLKQKRQQEGKYTG